MGVACSVSTGSQKLASVPSGGGGAAAAAPAGGSGGDAPAEGMSDITIP